MTETSLSPPASSLNLPTHIKPLEEILEAQDNVLNLLFRMVRISSQVNVFQCACACVSVCVSVYVYVCVSVCMCMCVSMCISIMCTCVCVSVRVHVCISMCVHVCLSVCVWACQCVCAPVYELYRPVAREGSRDSIELVLFLDCRRFNYICIA